MGFEAVVRKGVYKTRGDAKVAAEEKTLRNYKAALVKAQKAEKSAIAETKRVKKDITEAEKRLKYWKGEKEAEEE